MELWLFHINRRWIPTLQPRFRASGGCAKARSWNSIISGLISCGPSLGTSGDFHEQLDEHDDDDDDDDDDDEIPVLYIYIYIDMLSSSTTPYGWLQVCKPQCRGKHFSAGFERCCVFSQVICLVWFTLTFFLNHPKWKDTNIDQYWREPFSTSMMLCLTFGIQNIP